MEKRYIVCPSAREREELRQVVKKLKGTSEECGAHKYAV